MISKRESGRGEEVSKNKRYVPSRSESRRPIAADTQAEITKALALAAHFRDEQLTVQPASMVQVFARDIREPLALTDSPAVIAAAIEPIVDEPDYDPDTETVAAYVGREVHT